MCPPQKKKKKKKEKMYTQILFTGPRYKGRLYILVGHYCDIINHT